MATSNVAVTPGTGKNVATYSFTEDAETKEIQRVSLNDNAGVASNIAQETGGNLASIKTDLDTLAGIVGSAKAAVKSADGDFVTFGAKADAKSTATDTTAITAMQVFKQISYMLQNPPSTPVTIASLPALTTGTAAVGDINLNPAARGGWSPYFANAITTAATVSGSAGKFGGYMVMNVNSAPAYLQVFDTTGAVTLGVTTPTFVIPLPANSTAANGIAANVEFANGITIANGIKVAATTTATGSTTVSTGITGLILYK